MVHTKPIGDRHVLAYVPRILAIAGPGGKVVGVGKRACIAGRRRQSQKGGRERVAGVAHALRIAGCIVCKIETAIRWASGGIALVDVLQAEFDVVLPVKSQVRLSERSLTGLTMVLAKLTPPLPQS